MDFEKYADATAAALGELKPKARDNATQRDLKPETCVCLV